MQGMKESYEKGVANRSAPSFVLHTARCSAKRKSADEIAVAAQSFGQEDDITVLTVQRSAPCDGANA
jgi:hypothetical protein